MKIGSDLRETLDLAIHKRDRLLLVLSENSVHSPWVQRETEKALDEESRRKHTGRTDWRVLFPIRLDDSIFGLGVGWASDVQRRHIGDFRRWKDSDSLGIPMMSISHSDLMPIRSERSDAGLSQCETVIGIRQEVCLLSWS